MRTLSIEQQICVSGGQNEVSAKEATLVFLNNCTYEEMQMINGLFRAVLSDPSLIGADGETKRAALIEAVLLSDLF